MLNRNDQTSPWADGAAALVKAEWEWLRRDWEARQALTFVPMSNPAPSPPTPPAEDHVPPHKLEDYELR